MSVQVSWSRSVACCRLPLHICAGDSHEAVDSRSSGFVISYKFLIASLEILCSKMSAAVPSDP